jgi:hypothetical protein
MKAFLVCLNTSICGTQAHEVVFAESKKLAIEISYELAESNAESYGIYKGEEFFAEEEDPEEEVDVDSHIEFEIVTESDLEKANDYRCGGGSFLEEILEAGVILAD